MLCTLLATHPDIEVIGTANNGREALAWVEAQQPDLVVMDIQMPEMDGLEATRRMRQRFPGLPIILVALHDTAEVRRACYARGASGYVPKDRLCQELVGQINRLFTDTACGS